MKKEKNDGLSPEARNELDNLMCQTLFERTMRSHIESILNASGDTWKVDSVYSGLSLQKLEAVRPFSYIIPLIDKEKRDEYVNRVIRNPEKEVPVDMVYHPSGFYGIYEDELFVELAVFEKNHLTEVFKIPTSVYYSYMDRETKGIIWDIFVDRDK